MAYRKFSDLTGKRLGTSVVIRRDGTDRHHAPMWLCRCDCGEVFTARGDKLRNGNVTACQKCRPKRYKDMTGLTFGHLSVVRYAGPNHRGDATWECACDCGKTVVVQGQALRTNATRSCGCHKYDSRRNAGMSSERLYGVWQGMKRRCYSKSDKSFKYYGARGIGICDEWMDYQEFRRWAIGSGYDEDAAFQECTLDRINPYKDYSPDNCRWVDIVAQERNRRRDWDRRHGKGNHACADAVAANGRPVH